MRKQKAKSTRKRKAKVAAREQKPLTGKRALFVAEYLKDLNATQAAIRAGYSAKTAYSQGQRLLKDVEVAAAVGQAVDARAKRAEVDTDWVLKRLATELGADLADLFDDKGAMNAVKDWPMVWRQGLIAGVEIEELFQGTGKDRVHIGYTKKLKLSDRAKRLELLGRHVDVGAWRDKVEHDITDPLKQLAQDISGRALRPRDDGEAK